MGETAIEWTQHSWNPVVGCSVVSPGCTNCYAMRQAARIERMGGAPHYAGLTRASKAGPVWTGRMALAPEHVLLEPLRRRKPTTWFVNSMGDLFHEDVPDAWIDRVFAVMALAPQHTFQVLTKRADRMREYLSNPLRLNEIELAAERIRPSQGTPFSPKWVFRWPLPNVWKGVSAEDQRRADERIPDLLATPAAIRFVSAEPLLGPIDFTYLRADSLLPLDALTGLHSDCEGAVPGVIDNPDPKLDWIIVGGESGPDARPMHPDWARQIRDQCAAAGTAFFFKQWGEWGAITAYTAPGNAGSLEKYTVTSSSDRRQVGERVWHAGHGPHCSATVLRRVGKSRAGRLLDGATHNAMPEVRQ
jgi:protein gp37